VKKLLLSLLFTIPFTHVFACLILFITDGKTVLVANHEDWYARDSEVTFIPAEGKKFGMLYFDFTSEKTAQGGMNTAGLFFDGTRTPFAPYEENQSKEDCKCYIWTKILAECASVDQALDFVEKYKIPEIEDVHILFADKKGNSAVVGVVFMAANCKFTDGQATTSCLRILISLILLMGMNHPANVSPPHKRCLVQTLLQRLKTLKKYYP